MTGASEADDIATAKAVTRRVAAPDGAAMFVNEDASVNPAGGVLRFWRP